MLHGANDRVAVILQSAATECATDDAHLGFANVIAPALRLQISFVLFTRHYLECCSVRSCLVLARVYGLVLSCFTEPPSRTDDCRNIYYASQFAFILGSYDHCIPVYPDVAS